MPYIILSVAPLCWAGNIVLARGVAEIIPPVAFAFWRWSLAFVLILPFALRQLALDWKEVTRQWKMLFLLAVVIVVEFACVIHRVADLDALADVSRGHLIERAFN